MMQSCASAAKLRSGGPILPIGMKAKGHVGIAPPRTIISVPPQAYGQDRNCRGTFRILHSLCRTQNNAVRYDTLPHEPPQGDQKLRSKALRVLRAFSVRVRNHRAEALFFWNMSNRHADGEIDRSAD